MKKVISFIVVSLCLAVFGCPPGSPTSPSIVGDVTKNLIMLSPSHDTVYDMRGANSEFTIRWRGIVFTNSTTYTAPDNYRVCFDRDIYPRNGRRLSREISALDTMVTIRKTDLDVIPVSDSLLFLYVTVSSTSFSISDSRSADVRLITIRR